MAKYQPEHLARLERRIKIEIGLLPEKRRPIPIAIKSSKTAMRVWPQRQARPFSPNGMRPLRR